ncbi:MAG TPA: flagellar hook protein FlgE [Terriglobales bacterium]|jgi:flagellar hook protein FlgE|nr:flagellar hook protein FlgE [Terriglobales bacterium]
MPTFSIPLSGLTAESTALSAIANNLANQNTVGYKDVRVLFGDLFYADLGTTGSGDPIELGAGTKIGSMPGMFTQGSVESTGVPTDVAIQGEGFFVVQKNGGTSYTRAGNFAIDKNNFLVTQDGQQVMGYPAVSGVVTPSAGLSPLQLGAGTISPPTPTSSVQISANVDAGAAVGDTFSTPVTVFDSLGTSHVLTFTFTKTSAGNWDYSVGIPAADVSGAATLASGSLTFNGNGALTNVTPIAGGTVSGAAGNLTGIAISGLTDGATNMTFDWNLFNGTAPVITQVAGASTASSTQQDGSASGTLVNFSIGADGTVTGSFSNGRTAALGQIALAEFGDVEGLQRIGANLFTETLASGQAVVGSAGTGGRGSLSGGGLELSNVDIATEFANLIVAQRAFEANAKAVTTFDQITQDTINLKQG